MLQKTFFLQHLPLTLIETGNTGGKHKTPKESQSSHTGFIILQNLQRSKKYFRISIAFSPPPSSSLVFNLYSCPLDRHFSALNTFSTCEREENSGHASYLPGEVWAPTASPLAPLHLGTLFGRWKEPAGSTERHFKVLRSRRRYGDIEGHLELLSQRVEKTLDDITSLMKSGFANEAHWTNTPEQTAWMIANTWRLCLNSWSLDSRMGESFVTLKKITENNPL